MPKITQLGLNSPRGKIIKSCAQRHPDGVDVHPDGVARPSRCHRACVASLLQPDGVDMHPDGVARPSRCNRTYVASLVHSDGVGSASRRGRKAV